MLTTNEFDFVSNCAAVRLDWRGYCTSRQKLNLLALDELPPEDVPADLEVSRHACATPEAANDA